MRLDKLERQLRAQKKASRRKAKDGQRQLRDRARDLDRRIGFQIDALEKGIEPELVGQRIADLRAEKETVEAELKALGTSVADSDSDELAEALARLPDLSEALRQAPPVLKRQVFEAFCLEVRYDKIERRIEISATVSEAVAQAFENAKDLPQEVSRVTLRDIAGARFVPQSDARVVESMRLAA